MFAWGQHKQSKEKRKHRTTWSFRYYPHGLNKHWVRSSSCCVRPLQYSSWYTAWPPKKHLHMSSAAFWSTQWTSPYPSFSTHTGKQRRTNHDVPTIRCHVSSNPTHPHRSPVVGCETCKKTSLKPLWTEYLDCICVFCTTCVKTIQSVFLKRTIRPLLKPNLPCSEHTGLHLVFKGKADYALLYQHIYDAFFFWHIWRFYKIEVCNEHLERDIKTGWHIASASLAHLTNVTCSNLIKGKSWDVIIIKNLHTGTQC